MPSSLESKLYRNATYILAVAVAIICVFDIYIQPFGVKWHYFIFRPLTVLVLVYLGFRSNKKIELNPIFYDLFALTLFCHSFYGMLAIGPSYSFAFMQSFVMVSVVSRTTVSRFFFIQVVGLIMSLTGHFLTSQPRVMMTGYSFRPVFAFIAFVFQLTSCFIYVFVTRYRTTINDLTSKYALIGKQSAYLIHELKGPLMRSHSRSQTIQDEAIIPLRNELNHALSLIDSIEILIFKPSTISKRFTTFRLIDIEKLILDEYVHYLKAINISINFENKNAFIYGDKNLIHHLFRNIIINAIEAIGYREDKKPWIKIVAQENEAETIINISNSDSFMTSYTIRRAFQHSFSTKKEMGKGNRGLGLSLVKDIVNAHSGKIFVDSNKERTNFEIKLPKGPKE